MTQCKFEKVASICSGGWPVQIKAPMSLHYLKFANETCMDKNNLYEIPECHKRCDRDQCQIDFYKISDRYRWISNGTETRREGKIYFKLPSTPFTTYHHHPKLELVEFLCYLASIIS